MIFPANENLIVDAVEKVSKSVVNIASVRMVQTNYLEYFQLRV